MGAFVEPLGRDVLAGLRVTLISQLMRLVSKRRLAKAKRPEDLRTIWESFPPIAPRGVRFTAGVVGGVPGEWAEAAAGASKGALLYLHGGGYVCLSARSHRAITGGFATRGLRVFAPDYRLAPEHPFPAALDDATAVWRALRGQIEGPLFVSGDSAGGGLALALLLALRDRGEPRPAAASLFSPWTDLAGTGASLLTNRDRDALLLPDKLAMVALAYAGRARRDDPLVSPLYGDLSGLPPIQLLVGDTEILLDDSRRLAERIEAAGGAVRLRIYPDVPHDWPLMQVVLPQGRQALDEAAAFLTAAEA